jgi:uncharacterized glyoxalase superfamily protein PhnB
LALPGILEDATAKLSGALRVLLAQLKLELDHLQMRYGNTGPVLFWLNLDSKAEVDELFAQWKAAQAKIRSEPEDKPWKLREFMAADLDGNLIRVFYDFRGDV